MTVRDNSGKRTRQRVRPRRAMQSFDSKTLPELARKVTDWANGLNAMLNEFGAGFALDIVDGTADPARLLQRRPELEFEGAGVTLSTTAKRNVVTIPGGVTAATGYDGITSTVGGSTVTTRSSRLELVAPAFSTAQTSYAPVDSLAATTWDLCDFAILAANGASAALRTINSLAAPEGSFSTFVKELFNGGSATIVLKLLGSGTGPFVGTPGTIDFVLGVGEGCQIRWSPLGGGYYVISTAPTPMPTVITSHGDLDDLDVPADHPAYIMHNGDRDFTGDQSMGLHALTQASMLELVDNAPTVASNADIRLFSAPFADGGPGYISVQPSSTDWLNQAVGYTKGTATADASGTMAINFASINGRDLSDGVFKIIVQFAARCTTDPGSYPVVFAEKWLIHSGELGVQTMKHVGDSGVFAHWNDDGAAGVEIAASMASTDVVNIDWTLDIGAGSETWRYWVVARIEGGP